MTQDRQLDAVLINEGGAWSAQCLQYDIGASGDTIEEAICQLQRSVVGFLAVCDEKGLPPFHGLAEAPEAFWKVWALSEKLQGSCLARDTGR